MKISRFITSVILLTGWYCAKSQEQISPQRDFVPSEIIFAADVVGLGKTLFTDEKNLEFHSKIDFHQFYLAADFGFTEINPTGLDFDYKSTGSFFRLGPHVNMMPYNIHRGSIFFGLMYAKSSFNDEIQYKEGDLGWGVTDVFLSNDNINASWYEANLGLNVKIAGPLYFGYTIRFKFAKSMSGNGELTPFEIPGYGKASKGSRFSFNYYLIYKLRFRDKPIPKRPVRKNRRDNRYTDNENNQ